MADLTPELLAQLELLVDAGENFPIPLQSVTVRALVAAAKERDQLRRQLEREDLTHGKTINERDGFHDRIDEIADVLGDETEWSNCNDRGARALELAAEVIADRNQMRDEAAGLSEQLTESQLARIAMSEELDQLRATIERIKTFVADNAIINDFELEEILKGESP